MRHFLPDRVSSKFFGQLVLAGLGVSILCLPATVAKAGSAAPARGPAPHQAHITATSSRGNATYASTLAANMSGGLPVGGVLGDVTGDGLSDIVAIDSAGNMWD
jgi:hypothetical protein